LVADYKRGISTPKLCKQYDLSKWSVLKILNDHGVSMRFQSLTDEQIDQAVERYQAGDSLATIARHLGSSPTTVQRALISRGVAIRPKGGWHRARRSR
jgi:hypothetical protein